MLMSSVGLRSEKGCAGDARQKLKSTDPISHHRAPHHINKPESVKKNQRVGKIGSGSQVCLIPRRTGRQTVGHNVILTLTSLCSLDSLGADPTENTISSCSFLVVCVPVVLKTNCYILFTSCCVAMDGFSC
jgi:hypothetical protein